MKDAHTAEVRAKKKKRKAWEGLISCREGKAPHAGSQAQGQGDLQIWGRLILETILKTL